MAPSQTPGAMTLMLPAKPFTLRGVTARQSVITHSGHLGRGEQLQLSHAMILPHQGRRASAFDHAIFVLGIADAEGPERAVRFIIDNAD